MTWLIVIGLLILVVTLRICVTLCVGIGRGNREKEDCLETLIRNSEHSED